MKRLLNRRSIVYKLSMAMLIIILAQSAFLVLSITASGVIPNLRDNAYVAFMDKVNNRKTYLQNEMNLRWSNIDSYALTVSALYAQLQNQQGDPNQKLGEEGIESFLEEATPQLIAMLRATMTSGCFIILDDCQSKYEPRSAVYIKDYDPTLNNSHVSDLYMLKGPVEVSRSLQIPLDKSWSYGIALTDDTLPLFEKPYYSMNKGDNPKLLGYWSTSVNMSESTGKVVTYSMPLVGNDGLPIGVIGIELEDEYFYKLLPSTELDDEDPLGYLLALYDEQSRTLSPLLTRGNIQKAVVTDQKAIPLKAIKSEYALYEMTHQQLGNKVLAYGQDLKLYSNNTPFESEQWVLLGMVKEDSLLSIVHKTQTTLSLAFLISILFGTFTIYLVSNNFSKPIVDIAKKVKENNPKNVISLPKIGLSEIDDLSYAIEYLNENVLNSVMKMDKIISMVNMPIGAFEYKNGSSFITGTLLLFDILEIQDQQDMNSDIAGYTINSQEFFAYIDKIKERIEDQQNDIYILHDNPGKWLQIKIIYNEAGVLGVVIDVTKDILEKHLIKFDRDYDSLTKIYNRSAFHREAMRIFEQGNLKQAAFAMFDLDNLKYINDTYGHDLGDIYIKSAAQMISQLSQKGAIVGRMSGDEFYAFFYGHEDQGTIRDLMKGLYKTLDQKNIALPNGNEFKIRMSAGLTWCGQDSKNYDELIRFADFAMYEGKHTVKGEIREFNRVVYANESFMLSGKEELNKILDNQLVEFAFQPIINAKTGHIFGYESLMRPQSEVLNSPLKLIQIATAQSSLWKIERITFFKTLSTYCKYEDLFGSAKIFINSVPNQLLKPEEYIEFERLYSQVLPKIVVEVIENEKLDETIFNQKIQIIKSWGAIVALDDYGSGYNSEISLLSIEPQIVKVDRMMIDGIENDRNRQSILQKLITYSAERGIQVLAEGIETKEQMMFLISMGIDLLQGYYIGMPSFIPEVIRPEVQAEILEMNQ